MPVKIDLHTHSNYSDGVNSPRELLFKAKQAGIDIISITDHDSLNGIKEAREYGNDIGIEVIPGVEISSDIKDREIHILGFFVEPENEEIEHYLNFFRAERVKRAYRIIDKLKNLGFFISIEDVLNIAKNSAVGRPHIAQAMLANELVSNYQEAFNKYLGNGCIAYEKKVHLSPQSAFKIISDAGGLSFIAHPGNMPENILKELIESGVDGIEVIHPSHSSDLVQFYKGIVNEYFLLDCGGSDYHGGKREDDGNLGKYFIGESSLENMRKRLLRDTA
jgi:3',5'-nucleoside bisphosphate phosphatase